MKFYIAGKFEQRFKFREYREQLEALGHSVTSRWLNHGPEIKPLDVKNSLLGIKSDAHNDLEDIYNGDSGQTFTTEERGGRHVELGYKLALKELYAERRVIILVGKKTNIFHHH